MTKIEAKKINNEWCIVKNGKPTITYGAGTPAMLKAIHEAGRLRSPDPAEKSRTVGKLEKASGSMGALMGFAGGLILNAPFIPYNLSFGAILLYIGGILIGAMLQRGKK